MKPKVYIETSVISYYSFRVSRDVVVAGHQQATYEFWERLGSEFDPFVSALVVDEAEKGNAVLAEKRLTAIENFPVIQKSVKAEALAFEIIKGKGVPKEYPEDALHIAMAAAAGMDFVVTWNFCHINNPFTRMVIRQIGEDFGYVCPELASPDELLGEEQ